MIRSPRHPFVRTVSAPSVTRRTMLKNIGASTALTLGHQAIVRGAYTQGQAAPPRPVTSHPRLWLTEADLPRLRAWTTEDNPMWRDGLLPMADACMEHMDAGNIPEGDSGDLAYTDYPTENAAQSFAFLSLVHPDEDARASYAERARTLLMYVINKAAKGAAEDQPFRDPHFSIFDRSRWWGAGFPLTVDWIYLLLTAEEKVTIGAVFLRWIGENTVATVTGEYNHSQPVGVVNDPILLADPVILRWAGINYFTAHMRNIGLMALAFDAADDPDGVLTGNLAQATGAWLYMVDALLGSTTRTSTRSGVCGWIATGSRTCRSRVARSATTSTTRGGPTATSA